MKYTRNIENILISNNMFYFIYLFIWEKDFCKFVINLTFYFRIKKKMPGIFLQLLYVSQVYSELLIIKSIEWNILNLS